jgi:two-component system, OmpR family, phosphate regulon sensor histidine kinase PhoR
MPWLIGLTICALAGLIVLQGVLLNSAYESKEQAFSRNVWSALLAASFRMQAGETLTQVFRVDNERFQSGRHVVSTGIIRSDCDTVVFRAQSGQPSSPLLRTSVRVDGNGYEYHIDNLQQVDVGGNRARKRDSLAMTLQLAQGSGSARGFPHDSVRAVFVARVMDNLRSSDRQPLNRRFNPDTLDSVLKQSMQEAGISLEFAWGVLTARSDSGNADTVQMAHPADAAAALLTSEFHTPLSPLSPLGMREHLAVDFPGRNIYVLRQMWPTLGASFVFIALIALAFAYTIRTIVRQERLALHMVDFVNTMTHEFKTPLSTVTLASEAINRPDVVGRKARVLRYSRMIADEAARMKLQVDRILQVAQLEDGDLELSLGEIHMHDLLRTTAGAFALQVEARGGTLALDLAADNDLVNGDSVHLGNVFRSLLDNANKYSPAAPAIAVRSERREAMFIVQVSDKGIGIPPEHQKRVFDKFYRVPKGNLHDVKGFGIGLSYVKLLVEAHKGTVSLVSVPGDGTTVTLALPLLI